jgi:dTDP-4-amino-4,6-dideoxygalactose transaminase
MIAVHLYGWPFEVDAICRVCDSHGLCLMEDAAPAHDAR